MRKNEKKAAFWGPRITNGPNIRRCPLTRAQPQNSEPTGTNHHPAREAADYELTSHTTMASWLVPFRPCCVWRHATALAPLPHILPETRASSSSVISPPPPGSFLPPPAPAPAAPSRLPRRLFRHAAGSSPAAGASEDRQEPMAANGREATRWSTGWGW